jgi:hypothetical protein
MKTINNNFLESFNHLLDEVQILLIQRYNAKEFLDTDVDGSKFEKVVFDTIKMIQSNTKEPYGNWIPTLVGGKKFPDIVLQVSDIEKFGVEVKTSKGDDWKTLGGSIMESTRVDDVTHISILFAKLNPFVVRHKSFECAVSGVAVTHSPRYLIDLDVSPDKTIFKRINSDYDSIWQSEKPFEHFRQYFKDKAAREKTGLWWIDDEVAGSPDDLPGIQIQFFSKLPKDRKDYLINKSLILFPGIFSDVADYDEVSIWLVNMGILNNSLRDLYSAGEKVSVLGFLVPSKFGRLCDKLVGIQNLFRKIELEPSLMERFDTNNPNKAYQLWVEQVKMASSEANSPFLDVLFETNKFT